ncbi:hypothetical protein TKK_0004540 [Trichogramma kaykai]
MYDCYREVKKFLQLGHQKNLLCLVTKTGDAPLHLAIENYRIGVIELLLRNGAEPNLANPEGSTALHLICKINRLDEDRLVEKLFEVCGDRVRVDAQDNMGRTPLHCAMRSGSAKKVRLLLSRGADPNSIDEEGSTPLHVCFENHDKKLTDTFFWYGKEARVDARDKRGRTPLQLTVAHLLPDALYALLNNGADMSGFVFPSEADFEEHVKSRKSYESELESYPPKVKVIFDGPGVVRHLENREYQLAPPDAMKIMKVFVEHGSFEKPAHVDSCLYDPVDAWEYASLKKIKLSDSLSFHDVIRMPTAEAARLIHLHELQDRDSDVGSWRFTDLPGDRYEDDRDTVEGISLALGGRCSRGADPQPPANRVLRNDHRRIVHESGIVQCLRGGYTSRVIEDDKEMQ